MKMPPTAKSFWTSRHLAMGICIGLIVSLFDAGVFSLILQQAQHDSFFVVAIFLAVGFLFVSMAWATIAYWYFHRLAGTSFATRGSNEKPVMWFVFVAASPFFGYLTILLIPAINNSPFLFNFISLVVSVAVLIGYRLGFARLSALSVLVALVLAGTVPFLSLLFLSSYGSALIFQLSTVLFFLQTGMLLVLGDALYKSHVLTPAKK